MFAVIYKDRVIAGPMFWNRGIFEGALAKEGINVFLPSADADKFPLIINEDAKILSADERYPQINQIFEYYYGPLWEITDTLAIANYEVRDNTLETSKENFKKHIANKRWYKENVLLSLTLQEKNVNVSCKREDRDVFLQKYILMSETDSVEWKFSQIWLTLSKEEIKEIITVIDQHVQSCFNWEKTIIEQIDAATTKEELLLINDE
jgi:hypothetical protein